MNTYQIDFKHQHVECKINLNHKYFQEKKYSFKKQNSTILKIKLLLQKKNYSNTYYFELEVQAKYLTLQFLRS